MSSSWHHLPVFIYGTLKTGQPNGFRLQAAINKSKAERIGRAITTDCWPLIVYSVYNIPFLLDCKATGKRVVGELYRVDAETLALLDELEEHPDGYTRDTISVTLDSSPDDVITCESYLMKNFRRQLLTTETLIDEYRDTPERRYVQPPHRDPNRPIDIKELDDV